MIMQVPAIEIEILFAEASTSWGDSAFLIAHMARHIKLPALELREISILHLSFRSAD